PTTGTAHDEEEEDPELEPFVYGSRREPASPLVPMAVAKAAKKMHSHDELEAEITTMLGGSSLLSGGEQGSAQGNSSPGRQSSRAQADDDGPPLRLKTPKPTVRPLPEDDGPRKITLSSLDPLWTTNTHPGPQGPGPQTPDSKRNTDPSGTSSTYARPSTGDYDPLYYDAPSAASASYVDSQVPTSLGTIPNLAPSGQARYARHPRSPPRSWSPSRSPVRGPRASNVSYEPIDINGRSRPGTPSTMYGGSPRRPLPRAPTAAAATEEASIDIDAEEEDPFSDSRRDHNHSRLESRASTKTYSTYYSDSTITGNAEDEESSKVPLSDDDEDEDSYEGDSTSIDSRLNGPAPNGPHQRRGARPAQMTRKQVRLINGQLVLECKIPTTLSHFLPRRDDREFTHMRYTARLCTSKP
ncbi:Chitin synthase, class 2, partial [Ascosphaera atra]